MDFNAENAKSGAIKGGEAIAGAVLGTLALSKSPESIKKYMPVGLLVLGVVGLISGNEHAENIGSGIAVVGASATVHQMIKPEESTTVSGFGSMVKSAFPRIEGLGSVTVQYPEFDYMADPVIGMGMVDDYENYNAPMTIPM